MNDFSNMASALRLLDIRNQPRDLQMAILAIRNEPAVRRNMYGSAEISQTQHKNWLAHLAGSKTALYFLVLEQNELIGSIGFSNINLAHQRADWAFFLKSTAQGRGLGAAMELRALDYAFGVMRLNKLNCEVIDWNTPVLLLHEKFGFSREGRRRAHVLRGGDTYDSHLLGITAAEWAAQRPEVILNRRRKPE